MIAGMLNNNKINPINTFIRSRKVEIYVFITQPYFSVPKNIRLNSTHYSIMKIPNKRELQQIIIIHQIKGLYELFPKNVLQNHILSCLMIRYHQIVL